MSKRQILSMKPAKYAGDQPEPLTDQPDGAPQPEVAAAARAGAADILSAASTTRMLEGWLEQNLPGLVEPRLRDLLRPLLKDWFDRNMPPMVDSIVREEIERLIAGGRN